MARPLTRHPYRIQYGDSRYPYWGAATNAAALETIREEIRLHGTSLVLHCKLVYEESPDEWTEIAAGRALIILALEGQ